MPRSKNPVAIEVGKRLARARELLDLSQQEVADALGITVEAYGSYERGWHNVPMDLLPRLAEFIRMPVSYLVGASDPDGLAEDERMLLETYRGIHSAPVKKFVLDMVRHQAHLDQEMRHSVERALA